MKAIIAKNKLGYIGLDGKLPWKSSEDLTHFKQLTYSCVVLVGYRTYQTLPILPRRTVILDLPEMDEFLSIVQAMEKHSTVWCCGGKKTYEKWAPFFTELHISNIDDETVGDTMYPDLSNLNPDCKIFEYNFKTNP